MAFLLKWDSGLIASLVETHSTEASQVQVGWSNAHCTLRQVSPTGSVAFLDSRELIPLPPQNITENIVYLSPLHSHLPKRGGDAHPIDQTLKYIC